MSPAYTLVTYTCLHFALLPSTPLADFSSTFEQLSEPSRAQSDLKRRVASCHSAIPNHCESSECFALRLPEWECRIEDGSLTLRSNLQSFRKGFMQMGKVYHGIPSETRVLLSNEKVCGLTHQQFGIEERVWRDDPFFQPYIQAMELIKEVERAVRWTSCSDESLVEVARKINDCKALVSKVSGYEREIVAGMKMLRRVEAEKSSEELEAVNCTSERISAAKEAERKEERKRELLKKEEEVAVAAELAARANELATQQATLQISSPRRLCFGLLHRLRGKSKKQVLRLADSPKPKEPQFLQDKKVVVVIVANAALETMAIEQPTREARVLTKELNESGLTKSKAVQRKALLEKADLLGFLGRMDGFSSGRC